MKILWFSNSLFEGSLKVGAAYYAEEVSKKHKVFFIEPPVTIFHILKFFKNGWIKIIWNRILNSKKIRVINKNLLIYTPFSLFILNDKVGIDLFYRKWFSDKHVKKLRKNDVQEIDIVIIDNFLGISLLDKIKYKKLVVRITDNFEGFGVHENCIKIENELIKKADLIVSTSNFLIEQKLNKLNRNIIHLPNGVNYKKIENIRKLKLNNTSKSIKLVYVGLLDFWFDYKLLSETLDLLDKNNIELIIIGPVIYKDEFYEKLIKMKNVKFLGPKTFEEAMKECSTCDIGIIPFNTQKDITDYISPLKLYEYAACGLDIVTTNFKEVSVINESFIHKVNTSKEFVSILISYDKLKDKSIIYDYAKNNSWEKRATILLEQVE